MRYLREFISAMVSHGINRTDIARILFKSNIRKNELEHFYIYIYGNQKLTPKTTKKQIAEMIAKESMIK